MRKYNALACSGLAVSWALVLGGHAAPVFAADIAGKVQGGGGPIVGATVKLFSASADAPTQLAQGKTDNNGAFTLDAGKAPSDGVLYVVAKGGTTKAAA